LVEWAWRMCNRIWKGEEWPEEWKEGILIRVVKKGRGDKINEYRGITIMPSLYKVYTTVLAKRLWKEVEKKGLVPPNQAGFSRSMGTLDNVYALNYLVNRQIEKKGRKLVALF